MLAFYILRLQLPWYSHPRPFLKETTQHNILNILYQDLQMISILYYIYRDESKSNPLNVKWTQHNTSHQLQQPAGVITVVGQNYHNNHQPSHCAEDRNRTELERGERRGIEFNPHVLSPPIHGDDSFSDKRRLQVRGRNAVNDSAVSNYNGSNNSLPNAVLLHRPARRLDLRKHRHFMFSAQRSGLSLLHVKRRKGSDVNSQTELDSGNKLVKFQCKN